MKRLLRGITKIITKDRFEVRRTIWPYKEGWGTYNPATRTITDTGLSRHEAEQSCEELNNLTTP